MTEQELDEILTLKWPRVIRRAIAEDADEWLIGFTKSIARQARRRSWKPSTKQLSLIKRLVADLDRPGEGSMEVIER